MIALPPKRVLIIRFSSIGDIVLCSPVIRSLRKRWPACEIHFLTKAAFKPLLESNPHVDTCHVLDSEEGMPWADLKAAGFDAILDLHANIRTWQVKTRLGMPSASVDKRNWDKYRMVRFGTDLKLPHIVTRYGETLKLVDANLDEEGLEVFLPEKIEAEARDLFRQYLGPQRKGPVLAVVLGATYFTKRWPKEQFLACLQALSMPVLLLGGKDALTEADWLAERLPERVMNSVGKHSLLHSAALMKACQAVLTHDTGLMHMAAAFGQPIFSLWGNTVPAFGMTPYRTPHTILEAPEVSCRPCSKIGFDRCPRSHFDCMQKLSPSMVSEAIEEHFSQT